MKVTDEALLAYYRTKPCACCGKPPPSEVHHVLCRGFGGGTRLDVPLNLLPLCKSIPGYYVGCHATLQEGRANRDWCLAAIAEREGLETWQVVLEALWRLQRAPKRMGA